MSVNFDTSLRNEKEEKIRALLRDRDVTSEDFVAWLNVYSGLDDPELAQFLNTIRDETIFSFLNENLKEKRKALASDDHRMITRILKKEELFLESLKD